MQYWPASKDKDEEYGGIGVSVLKEEELANFHIRTIKLYKKNGNDVSVFLLLPERIISFFSLLFSSSLASLLRDVPFTPFPIPTLNEICEIKVETNVLSLFQFFFPLLLFRAKKKNVFWN